MRSRTLSACCCVAFWFASARISAAQDSNNHIHLNYAAPEGCPDREAVLHAIDALLDPAEALDTTLQVQARVDRNGENDYALSLSWTSANGTGHRNIDAESCQAAADAAAWLVALAIKSPTHDEPAATSDDPRSTLSYEFSLGAASAFGTLPGIGWGASLRGAVVWSGLHAGLGLAYFPSKQLQRGGASVDLDLTEVSANACYLFARSSLAAGPCVQATLGRMAATSRGLNTPENGDARFQAFAAGVQLRSRIFGTVWLVGDAELAWHQRRPLFVLSGGSTLHQPRSVGLSLGVALLLALD